MVRYNQLFLELFGAFLQLFDGQYPIMGNAQAMTAKIVWDNASYWGFNALLFFNRKYIDLAFMERISLQSRRFILLHHRMQTFLRQWDQAEQREWRDAHVNLLSMEFMYALQSGLAAPHTDETLAAQLERNMTLLEGVAAAIEDLGPRGLASGRRRIFADDSPDYAEVRRQLRGHPPRPALCRRRASHLEIAPQGRLALAAARLHDGRIPPSRYALSFSFSPGPA